MIAQVTQSFSERIHIYFDGYQKNMTVALTSAFFCILFLPHLPALRIMKLLTALLYLPLLVAAHPVDFDGEWPPFTSSSKTTNH